MTTGKETILESFETAAGAAGTVTILSSGDPVTRSYKDLCERAREAAGVLAARDIGPGDVVGVLAAPSIDFFIGCLAVWGAGAALVPLPLRRRLEARASWDRRLATTLQTTGAHAVLVDEGNATIATDKLSLTISSLRGPGAQPAASRPSDVALLQLTSGTSSDPKALVVSYRTLRARLDGFIREGASVEHQDRYFHWGPLFLGAGISSGLLRPLSTGVPTVILPTKLFLASPERWLVGISEAKATRSGGPHFAYALATHYIKKGLHRPVDLSSWRVASNAGEPIDPVTARRFIDAAGPLGFDAGAFTPRYSLTEVGNVTTRRPGQGLKVDKVDRAGVLAGEARPVHGHGMGTIEYVCVGTPRPDVHLKIEDGDGRAVGERRVGEILVRSPRVADSYLDTVDAIESPLKEGWLRTGDLGYLADDELYITGRKKDIVILKGQNHYATDIERSAQSAPGVRGGCAALSVSGKTSEELIIVAESELVGEAAIDAVRADVKKAVWSELGINPTRVDIVSPGSLPRTSGGKIQKHLLRERYHATGRHE